MIKLRFTRQALFDLHRLREFIAEKNPIAAEKYSQKLVSTIHQLKEQPELGKVLDDEPRARELIAGNYIIHYALRDETIYILKIWHGKEDR